jgi:quercetin dioxygenase-like cupin family protein
MKALDRPRDAARNAVAANPARPATAVLHDADDVRLVVFRLAPGQSVPPHRSVSTVLLTVVEGAGVISGEDGGTPVDRRCATGDVVAFEPNELHGMRAEGESMMLLATITPRPGSR